MIEKMLTIRFQRIDIEKLVSFQIYPRQRIIKERDLCYIKVFRILVQESHAVVEKHIGNRCTGFIVSLQIGKIIVFSESFNAVNRTQTAGNMHLFIHYIFPDILQGLGVRVVSR